MKNRGRAKEKQRLNKTITPEDHLSWIGKVICKHSGKKFSTDEKTAVPSEIVNNPRSGKHAFVIDDGSLIDCYQCKLYEEPNEFTETVFEYIERGTRFFTSYTTDDSVEGLKIICHCKSVAEAQAVCSETAGKNWFHYFNDMAKTLNQLYD